MFRSASRNLVILTPTLPLLISRTRTLLSCLPLAGPGRGPVVVPPLSRKGSRKAKVAFLFGRSLVETSLFTRSISLPMTDTLRLAFSHRAWVLVDLRAKGPNSRPLMKLWSTLTLALATWNLHYMAALL